MTSHTNAWRTICWTSQPNKWQSRMAKQNANTRCLDLMCVFRNNDNTGYNTGRSSLQSCRPCMYRRPRGTQAGPFNTRPVSPGLPSHHRIPSMAPRAPRLLSRSHVTAFIVKQGDSRAHRPSEAGAPPCVRRPLPRKPDTLCVVGFRADGKGHYGH